MTNKTTKNALLVSVSLTLLAFSLAGCGNSLVMNVGDLSFDGVRDDVYSIRSDETYTDATTIDFPEYALSSEAFNEISVGDVFLLTGPTSLDEFEDDYNTTVQFSEETMLDFSNNDYALIADSGSLNCRQHEVASFENTTTGVEITLVEAWETEACMDEDAPFFIVIELAL